MQLKEHYLYIIKDEFYEKFNDPNLKGNKQENRPHYYCFKDKTEELYWVIPLSSKVEKFEKIIKKKEEKNIALKRRKRCDNIYIINLSGEKNAVLIQDMFPITKKYIKRYFTKNSNAIEVKNEKDINEIKIRAKQILSLIKKGIRFMPNQANVLKIKKELLKELEDKT